MIRREDNFRENEQARHVWEQLPLLLSPLEGSTNAGEARRGEARRRIVSRQISVEIIGRSDPQARDHNRYVTIRYCHHLVLYREPLSLLLLRPASPRPLSPRRLSISCTSLVLSCQGEQVELALDVVHPYFVCLPANLLPYHLPILMLTRFLQDYTSKPFLSLCPWLSCNQPPCVCILTRSYGLNAYGLRLSETSHRVCDKAEILDLIWAMSGLRIIMRDTVSFFSFPSRLPM